MAHKYNIHPSSVIADSVTIGDGVVIHPFVVVCDDVCIGDGVEIFPHAFIGKEPKGAGALARQPEFNKRIKIGADSSIGPGSVIYYDVSIGDNTLIGDGASIREKTVIGSRCVIGRYVTINYETTIHDRVKIMDHSWMAGRMTIEDDVFVSGGVMTTNDNAIGRAGYDEDDIVGPFIHKNAVIGAGAVLLPKTKIGENSVVAAGAVVTKDVPANGRVFGVPAKLRE